MKAKFSVILGVIVASMFAVPHVISCQDSGLAGEWVTTNARTRGITRIIVSREGAGWSAQTFGRCHPHDCDWGWVPLLPVGASVEDDSFGGGFAVWNAGFATKYVTMLKTGDTLTVETVTIFKDRSRRANFRAKEVLKRDGPME